MAAKKYIATQVALKANQKDALEKASAKMAKHIGIKLSRSDVIERLCKLYNDGTLEEAK